MFRKRPSIEITDSFKYIIMPMGAYNALGTSQTVMNQIFHDCMDKFVMVYIDDH